MGEANPPSACLVTTVSINLSVIIEKFPSR